MDTITGALEEESVNAALFCDFGDIAFITDTLKTVQTVGQTCLISDDPALISVISADTWLTNADTGFDRVPMDTNDTIVALREKLTGGERISTLIVDMTWGVETVLGSRAFEAWGRIAEKMAEETGVTIVSLYNRHILIEEQLLVAFRAHKQFVAPSGVYENPFWLPAQMISGATIDEQIVFLLSRAVPDYSGLSFFKHTEKQAARGASPEWLARPKHVGAVPEPTARWDIHCLGPLRVFKNGHQLVNWKVPGSSPNKVRTLFAYLLNGGEKGAHVDRISELLWPDGQTEKAKRARLHHTVAMLRKALGGKEVIELSGEFYRLNAPAGTWIDMSAFEQMCRRGLALLNAGDHEEAMKVYGAADRLYRGDLFEDVPVEYVHYELEDWVLPRRVWFREMAVKLQRNMSIILRGQGQYAQALEHCLSGLTIDPTSEIANAEAMRVYHAQGRLDTVVRQYRQYCKAMEAMGVSADQSEVVEVFNELSGAA